jgi:anaerobic selenocysteine-containing dehydrogenase
LKEEKRKHTENEGKKQSNEVSRRDFLVGASTVVVGGAIGAGMFSSCDGETVTKTIETTKTVEKTTTLVGSGAVTVTETKQVGADETITSTVTSTKIEGGVEPAFEEETTVIKQISPGGITGEPCCVDVKNGKIVRIRPLHYDWKYTKDELADALWAYEAKGKTFEAGIKSLPSYFALAYKKRIYSPIRTKYPLQRVDWEPGGGDNVNPQNRGKSKFKRITWDEATSIVASEIKRVRETYGNYAILCIGADGHHETKNVHSGQGAHMMLMNLCGGYTLEFRNADSWEGWYWGAMHVWGTGENGLAAGNASATVTGDTIEVNSMQTSLFDTSENTEMIVYTGCDYETTPQGFAGQYMSRVASWLGELGIKQVYVSPELNYQGAAHPDKWIPVLPNTDMCWQMAVIYIWIVEDTYDKDFVETHTIGFDKIRAYILGEDDGIPKTPAWAAPRCGMKEWTIKALARQWAAKKTSTGHYFGSPMARGPYSTEPARWEAVQLGMQGIGKPGVMQLYGSTLAAPPHVGPAVGMTMALGRYLPFSATPQVIARTLVHRAIIDGHSEQWGLTGFMPVDDQFIKYIYPIASDEGGTEIHMAWSEKPCNTACWNHSNKFIDAFRTSKIECYVVNHQWLQNDAIFADIVFPVSCQCEEDDIYSISTPCSVELAGVCVSKKAVKPIGESKSDYEIAAAVSKKLEEYGGQYEGLYDAYTEDMTIEERIESGFAQFELDDIISWEDMQEKQYCLTPLVPGWEQIKPTMKSFYDDPESNPLDLPSGKMEFYSDRLATSFPDDKERGPMPKYVIGGPESEGWIHDESLYGERVKKYPLLLEANHPRWRHHPQCDDIAWFREIPTMKIKGYDGYMYEPVWIHPTTAAERGIEHGDIVKVYNDRGIELGGAYVTERMIPGAAHMDHGAAVDMITDRINRGGTVNPITPEMGSSKYCWGMAVSGFLVQVEKLDPAQMEEWRKTYPEAFARDYDPAYGIKYDGWVEKEV